MFNPLNIEREDVVEAQVEFPGGTPKAVRVVDHEGREVASQFEDGKVLFVGKGTIGRLFGLRSSTH